MGKPGAVYSFDRINTMVADDLATQGVKASVAVVLIQFSPNISFSAPEE